MVRQTRSNFNVLKNVCDVQRLWKDIYGLSDLPADGSQRDRLLEAGAVISIGPTNISAMFSPGHTLALLTYVTCKQAFVHDMLMIPDAGNSRADSPSGDACQLYSSILEILALSEHLCLFMGHDYCPDDRPLACAATVAEQR